MIRTFRKSWKSLKRTVCAALALIYLSSLLMVSVGAAEFSGDLGVVHGVSLNGVYSESVSSYKFPVDGSSQSNRIFLDNSLVSSSISVAPVTFNFPVSAPLSGEVGLYVSYYYVANFTSSWSIPALGVVNDYTRYSTSDGVTHVVAADIEFLSFPTIPVDGSSVSSGRALKVRVSGIDSLIDVSRFYISPRFTSEQAYFITKPAGTNAEVYFYMPSLAFITSESAGTLDGLESIADALASQSQILNAMYGDIMELLNDLYARLGDMQAVEELTNTYFAQLIPLVNSINTNTANIYSLLQTQFALLRSLIATESDDIQAAIEKQTQDLKAYFDAVFSGAVGDMPEKSDDLETSVGDFSSAEQDYQSNASARFDELAASFNGFSGGTLSGITLASTLFTRVWDALGEYSIVYLYPLLLGLCLLLIGRLSRLSGGQSSSEKHRGDSDA